MTTMQGIIHGRIIELEQEPGLPDGQAVAVTIQRIDRKPAKTEDPSRVQSWMDRLVFDSAVRPGERVVKGTSLAAEALAAELEKGRSDEEMLQAHPELSKDDLAVLRDYARLPAGIRRSAGAWAEDGEELDQFIAWTYEQRKVQRRPLEP